MFYIVYYMTLSRLGEFELSVLVAVARLGDTAYGASVRENLSSAAGREYSVGAVGTTLQRLEDKRLVVSWFSAPEPVRGGRAKRCFKLTPAGRRALAFAREASRRLWAGDALGNER